MKIPHHDRKGHWLVIDEFISSLLKRHDRKLAIRREMGRRFLMKRGHFQK